MLHLTIQCLTNKFDETNAFLKSNKKSNIICTNEYWLQITIFQMVRSFGENLRSFLKKI